MILQRVLFFVPLILGLNFCHAAIDAQGEQDKPEVDSFFPSLMQSARFMRIQPVASQEQEQSVQRQEQLIQTPQPFDYYDAARTEDQQQQAQQQRDSGPEFSNPEFIPLATIVRPANGFYGRIVRYQPPTFYQNRPIGPIQSQVFVVDGGVPSYEDTPSEKGQFPTTSSENPGELPPIVRPAVEPVIPRPKIEDPKEDNRQVEAKVQESTSEPSTQTEKIEEASTQIPKDLESESVDWNQSTETPTLEAEAPKFETEAPKFETDAQTSETEAPKLETEAPQTEETNSESSTQEPLLPTEEEPKVVDSETGEKSDEAEKALPEKTENFETTATDAPKEAETEEAQIATEAPKEAESGEVQTENKETVEPNPTTALPEIVPDKLLEETTAGVENKPEDKVQEDDSSTAAPTVEETTVPEVSVAES